MGHGRDWVSGRTCVYNIGYHIVWSTKYRRHAIVGDVETRLKVLLQEIASEHGFIVENMEVMPDHIHVFASAHPKVPPSTLVKLLKGVSARKLFIEFPELRSKLWGGHLWNPSFYVGTAGSMSKDVIMRYIDEQKNA